MRWISEKIQTNSEQTADRAEIIYDKRRKTVIIAQAILCYERPIRKVIQPKDVVCLHVHINKIHTHTHSHIDNVVNTYIVSERSHPLSLKIIHDEKLDGRKIR